MNEATDPLEAAKIPHPQPEKPEGADVIDLGERREKNDAERGDVIVMRRRRPRRHR